MKKMKRILIPILLVATILAGGVFAYVIWHAVPLSSQDYFNGGKKYYDESQFSAATIQFLNAVQKDPANRDVRYYLALSYLGQNDLNNAARQLAALLEFYPDDIDANIRLGGIYLTGGSANPDLFRQASAIAQKVLAKDPKNVGALILSGNAAAGLQDYRSSEDFFRQAIALDQDNTAAYVSLASSQALQRNFREAEHSFLKARQIDPKNKRAIISLGNYYRAIQASDKADALYKEALSVYPADKDIYAQAVAFYYQAGRLEEVEQILHTVQSAGPEDPAPSLLLASLYTARNRSADARTLLLDLKKRFPDDLDVARNLASNLIQDHPDQAKTEIDRILKANPADPSGRLLLAQMQFDAGQYELVRATLASYPSNADGFPQASLLLGEIANKKGQFDQAQKQFQQALSANSNYLPALMGLAEAFMNQGRLADSRVEIHKILKAQSDHVPARLLEAALNTAEKKYSDAEPALTALQREQPNNPLVHRQMALYLDSRGRTAEAEKSFVRALDLQPDSPARLLDLTKFYLRSHQAERAIQRINRVPDKEKQAFHYELLGGVYAQAGKLPESEAAYKAALEKDPSNTSSVANLANLYIQSGRMDEGVKALDALTTKNPSNSGAFAIKGMICEKQDKVDEAKQNYALALKADAGNETAANNLAFILAEQGQDLTTALGYAQMARKKQPDNAAIADTLGWVYYKSGNFLLARDQLLFAAGKDPSRAQFQYHLGLIYKSNKQTEEARTALAKAVKSPDPFKEKTLAQASLKELR
jgi:tetratricopeptide (TPR) repeat protein